MDVDDIALDPVNFDAVQFVFKICVMAAVALASDFRIINHIIEFKPDRKRKRRRQRPAASPRRRMDIGDIEQHRRQRRFRGPILARRQQFTAMVCETGVAAEYVEFPACDAVITTAPAPVMDRVVPLIIAGPVTV